jgi:hypothetical protein
MEVKVSRSNVAAVDKAEKVRAKAKIDFKNIVTPKNT